MKISPALGTCSHPASTKSKNGVIREELWHALQLPRPPNPHTARIFRRASPDPPGLSCGHASSSYMPCPLNRETDTIKANQCSPNSLNMILELIDLILATSCQQNLPLVELTVHKTNETHHSKAYHLPRTSRRLEEPEVSAECHNSKPADCKP